MTRNRLLITAVAVVAIGVGLFAAQTLFFDNEPAEVSLAGRTADPTDGEVEFDGTWTVDSASGDLDAEPPTSTFAGYRIQEEFAGVGANTAVGRTRTVSGTMTIDGNQITDAEFTVDMTTLQSDQDRRDNALRDRGLETARFPSAKFSLTSPIEIAEEPAEGEKIEVEATGDFTLHGVTKQVTIPLEALWEGETLTVISSFDVDLDDYNMERPTTARVISIADKGKVELQLLMKKA